MYGASTASYPSTSAPGTPSTGLLLCFHSWRGPFGEPLSSGQYSSKRNLLPPVNKPARIDMWEYQETTVIRMYCAMTGVAKRASRLPLASVKVAPPSTSLHVESSVLC